MQFAHGVARHHLGLGPRDEDPSIHQQVQLPEAPPTHDVLERLAADPALDHGVQRSHPANGGRFTQALVELGPLVARGLFDDAAGVDLG